MSPAEQSGLINRRDEAGRLSVSSRRPLCVSGRCNLLLFFPSFEELQHTSLTRRDRENTKCRGPQRGDSNYSTEVAFIYFSSRNLSPAEGLQATSLSLGAKLAALAGLGEFCSLPKLSLRAVSFFKTRKLVSLRPASRPDSQPGSKTTPSVGRRASPRPRRILILMRPLRGPPRRANYL